MKKFLKLVEFGFAIYGAGVLVKKEATKYWRKEGPYIKAKVQRYFVNSMYDSLKQRIETKKTSDILRNGYKYDKQVTTNAEIAEKFNIDRDPIIRPIIKMDTVPDNLGHFVFRFRTMSQLTYFVRKLNNNMMDYDEVSIRELIDIYREFADVRYVEDDINELNAIDSANDEDFTSFSEMPDFEVIRDCRNDCWRLIFDF